MTAVYPCSAYTSSHEPFKCCYIKRRQANITTTINTETVPPKIYKNKVSIFLNKA